MQTPQQLTLDLIDLKPINFIPENVEDAIDDFLEAPIYWKKFSRSIDTAKRNKQVISERNWNFKNLKKSSGTFFYQFFLPVRETQLATHLNSQILFPTCLLKRSDRNKSIYFSLNEDQIISPDFIKEYNLIPEFTTNIGQGSFKYLLESAFFSSSSKSFTFTLCSSTLILFQPSLFLKNKRYRISPILSSQSVEPRVKIVTHYSFKLGSNSNLTIDPAKSFVIVNNPLLKTQTKFLFRDYPDKYLIPFAKDIFEFFSNNSFRVDGSVANQHRYYTSAISQTFQFLYARLINFSDIFKEQDFQPLSKEQHFQPLSNVYDNNLYASLLPIFILNYSIFLRKNFVHKFSIWADLFKDETLMSSSLGNKPGSHLLAVSLYKTDNQILDIEKKISSKIKLNPYCYLYDSYLFDIFFGERSYHLYAKEHLATVFKDINLTNFNWAIAKTYQVISADQKKFIGPLDSLQRNLSFLLSFYTIVYYYHSHELANVDELFPKAHVLACMQHRNFIPIWIAFEKSPSFFSLQKKRTFFNQYFALRECQYLSDAASILKSIAQTLGNLTDFKNAIDWRNIRTIQEMHNHVAKVQTTLRHKNIPCSNPYYSDLDILDLNVPDTSYQIKFAPDTHTVIGWGTEQRHCITNYKDYINKSDYLIFGVWDKENNKWFGHCILYYYPNTQSYKEWQFYGFANSALDKDVKAKINKFVFNLLFKEKPKLLEEKKKNNNLAFV